MGIKSSIRVVFQLKPIPCRFTPFSWLINYPQVTHRLILPPKRAQAEVVAGKMLEDIAKTIWLRHKVKAPYFNPYHDR